MKKVRFTKHAYEKFALLKKYGFPIDEAAVRQAIASPTQLGRRGDQLLALNLSVMNMPSELYTKKPMII